MTELSVAFCGEKKEKRGSEFFTSAPYGRELEHE